MTIDAAPSANFGFLGRHDVRLARLGAQAERYFADDPQSTLTKLRLLAELLAQEPNPDEAVIGLRNHGITVTGPSLMAILDRIEPRILRQIPML